MLHTNPGVHGQQAADAPTPKMAVRDAQIVAKQHASFARRPEAQTDRRTAGERAELARFGLRPQGSWGIAARTRGRPPQLPVPPLRAKALGWRAARVSPDCRHALDSLGTNRGLSQAG